MSADEHREDIFFKAASQRPRQQDGSGEYGLERAAQEPRAFEPPSGGSDVGHGVEGRDDGLAGPFGAQAAHAQRSFLIQARDEVSAWFGDTEAARRRLDDDPSHAGKGPSVCVHSDERLRFDVCGLLNDDPIIDARNIEVTVKDREVTLDGHVQRHEDRRRAEDLTDRVYGIIRVQNNLRFVAADVQIPAGTGKKPTV